MVIDSYLQELTLNYSLSENHPVPLQIDRSRWTDAFDRHESGALDQRADPRDQQRVLVQWTSTEPDRVDHGRVQWRSQVEHVWMELPVAGDDGGLPEDESAREVDANGVTVLVPLLHPVRTHLLHHSLLHVA